MTPLIECRDLAKIYDHQVEALRGVTLHVNSGEFVCLTGRSGSGKTTLLNCLGTLDLPTTGSIFIQGEKLDPHPSRKNLELRRTFFGFVFQEFHLISYLSACENVALPLVFQGISWRKALKIAAEILEAVGVSSKTDQAGRTLSGGEAQRVAIGRAIVGKPRLLLADEPTGELDSQTAASIVELLKSQRKRGMTLIVVSHDPAIISAADRVLSLADGKLLSVTI